MSHKKSDSDKKAAGTYRAGDKRHLGEPLTVLPKEPFPLNDEAHKIFIQEAVALIEARANYTPISQEVFTCIAELYRF